MKKITTLFKKDPNDLGRVINEINPENVWALHPIEATPTRKYDGTACAPFLLPAGNSAADDLKEITGNLTN